MIKRGNKIIALLVAATSVMSLVPAMAADYTRLGTKDGTIESAIAFNGKYIYEGYKGDESKAVWFNDGSKDKELTDFEDYDFTDDDGIKTYGEKYALAEDNDDEYLVDLSNGNITDDTLEDKLDSTASKLEKALSKTDKYDGTTVESGDLNKVSDSASFQDPWYYVTKNHEGKETRIFTDVNGKYVDSSVLANIYAYSSKRQEVVKINKFDTEYKDTALKVEIAKQQPKVIAQDKDYLYAIVNVDITDSNSVVSSDAARSSVTVDLSDAKYALQKHVTDATAATITADWTKVTTGSAVTFAGYTTPAFPTLAEYQTDIADHFITNAKAGYEYKRSTTTASKGQFVAKTDGIVIDANKPVFAATDIAVFANGTAGSTSTSATDIPSITIAGVKFEYNATVTADATVAGVPTRYYQDPTSLKNKIIAEFVGGISHYDFDATTLTFTDNTAVAAGAAYVPVAETAIKTIFGTDDVLTIKTGSAASVGSRVTNAWYLQKISKAQGSTDEEASIPKEVKSYQLDNKSLYDNGDVKDATDWLITDGAVNKFVNVEVKGNSLYAYKLSDSDTVKVLKLDLKQIKENAVDKVAFGTSKLDGYVVKKDGDTDQDFDAYSVDVNGVLWILNDGKIIKFDEKDKTTVYTCDSGLDRLSVYDENNLIAWNEDDERYTTVTEGTKVTQDESAAVAPVIVTGWVQDGSNWVFNDVTGAKVTNKWINVSGSWYFLKDDGSMATGWHNVNGTWYFLNPVSDGTKGAMKTGWLNDNGNWYFLKADGSMATGWYNSNGTWYFLNPVSDGTRGVMKTGWLNDNGTWYFLNSSGAMLANTTVGGYRLNASGAWVK